MSKNAYLVLLIVPGALSLSASSTGQPPGDRPAVSATSCVPDNDRCGDATVVHEAQVPIGFVCPGIEPFDGSEWLNECGVICEFPCVHSDVWYDFVAPCDGVARIEMDGGVGHGPSLIVYDGCQCFPEILFIERSVVTCNAFMNLSRSVEFSVIAGHCYKVKLANVQSFVKLLFETTPSGYCFCDDAVGDVDGNGRIDLTDFAALGTCLDSGGEGLCVRCFDFNNDGEVDLLDFADFQVAYSGH